MPNAAEYKLRDREEAEIAHRDWKRNALAITLEALSTAATSPQGQASSSIPSPDHSDQPLEIHVTLQHDTPQEDPQHSQSLAELFLLVADHQQESLREELLRCLLPVLQPDATKIDSTFRIDGQLEIWLELTQAKVIQLAAISQETITDELLESACTPNTLLHYVSNHTLTEALVTGKATRAICGAWFVPTKDESTELPICPLCDAQKPFADGVTAIIRESQNPSET